MLPTDSLVIFGFPLITFSSDISNTFSTKPDQNVLSFSRKWANKLELTNSSFSFFIIDRKLSLLTLLSDKSTLPALSFFQKFGF